MSLKIGITGGIGAGKSLVAEIFKTFGIPVYKSDTMAKRLMNDHPDLKESIIKAFGKDVYKYGSLNKSYLSQIIFQNKEVLNQINEMVHPVVKEDYNQWLLRHSFHHYTLKEAALLFEAETYKELDRIILVYAPKKIRVNRVLLRDPYRTQTDIDKIIGNQMKDNEKKKLADFIIVNDERIMVIPQVLEVHEKLMNIKD